MARKFPGKIVLLIAVVILLLTGCSTSITLRTLVPANVDISGYKTIAVMSTTDRSRWIVPMFWKSRIPIRNVFDVYRNDLVLISNLDFNASERITEAASTMIYKAVDTDFYKVLTPELTDAYVLIGQSTGNLRSTLMNNGIDAILKTEISSLYYDEYITQKTAYYSKTDKNGVKFNPIVFYLCQDYAVSITYTLTDVENNRMIAHGTFDSKVRHSETQIGNTVDAQGKYESSYYHTQSASSLIKGLLQEFTDNFRNDLSPHYVSTYFEFMANKPKVKTLKEAYKAADRGDYRSALRLFLDEYNLSGHVASGYNAAVLYFALGEHDSAFALAQELYRSYGSSKALILYNYMMKIHDQQEQAINQITSDVKSGSITDSASDLVGF